MDSFTYFSNQIVAKSKSPMGAQLLPDFSVLRDLLYREALKTPYPSDLDRVAQENMILGQWEAFRKSAAWWQEWSGSSVQAMYRILQAIATHAQRPAPVQEEEFPADTFAEPAKEGPGRPRKAPPKTPAPGAPAPGAPAPGAPAPGAPAPGAPAPGAPDVPFIPTKEARGPGILVALGVAAFVFWMIYGKKK
jgi:hypothetical protein